MSMFEKGKQLVRGALASMQLAAPVAAPAIPLAVALAPEPASAADLSGIKQSCNDAGRALLGTAHVDITNSYTVQQNLVNYWNGVGDTARASEASHIQGGQWNAKAKRYEHADFIGLQAALSEAQADFASRDQSCKAPAPQAEAPLPQFVAPNLSLEITGTAGVFGKDTKQYTTAGFSGELSATAVAKDDAGNHIYIGGFANQTLPADLSLDSNIAMNGLDAKGDLSCIGGRAGVGTSHVIQQGDQLRLGARAEKCDMDVKFTYNGKDIGSAHPEGTFIGPEVTYIDPNGLTTQASVEFDSETGAAKAGARIGFTFDALSGNTDKGGRSD